MVDGSRDRGICASVTGLAWRSARWSASSPGKPEDQWPWFYIDPDTCIDCGACVPECPVEAIFPEEDVPQEFVGAIAKNRAFFSEGPGYQAKEM